jgi:hypothetical protein
MSHEVRPNSQEALQCEDIPDPSAPVGPMGSRLYSCTGTSGTRDAGGMHCVKIRAYPRSRGALIPCPTCDERPPQECVVLIHTHKDAAALIHLDQPLNAYSRAAAGQQQDNNNNRCDNRRHNPPPGLGPGPVSATPVTETPLCCRPGLKSRSDSTHAQIMLTRSNGRAMCTQGRLGYTAAANCLMAHNMSSHRGAACLC